MCRKHLFDREIVQLLEYEPPSDSEDDLESGYEQGIYIDDDIVGLEELDKFLENIDDDELESFLNSINLLDSNFDINIDMRDVECEPDDQSISLPNFIFVQPHTKNEINKTPDLKIKNLRKKFKLDITTPLFVAKPQLKVKNKKKQKLDISWKHEKLSTQNVEFTGDFELSHEILNLSTPYQIFGYFFQDDLIEHIVYETLIYSVQINPNNNFKLISNDVKKYLGVCLLMGLVNISNIRKYWSPNLGNQIIQETMSVNQFEQIRQFIHFNNNNNMLPKCHVGHDRGRPSNTIENALIQKSKKPNALKPPNQDIRMDRIDHWPIDAPTRSRCKMPGCKGYTWQACEKCQLQLHNVALQQQPTFSTFSTLEIKIDFLNYFLRIL
ncbi:hypothetical protein QTP88_023188 [Uroleucon formosanum]